jgi:calcineurin-like phosphoesterase family protein
MSNRFVISDTHFNHARVLTFQTPDGLPVRSGFDSVEHMNEVMIDNWNKTVSKRDVVWHLGDVFFGSEKEGLNILRRLNGRKKLIVGNHDHLTPDFIAAFDEVTLWKKSKGDGFVLSHMPLHSNIVLEALGDNKRVVNIHGHIHEKKSPIKQPAVVWENVSVEQINYTPVPLESFL